MHYYVLPKTTFLHRAHLFSFPQTQHIALICSTLIYFCSALIHSFSYALWCFFLLISTSLHTSFLGTKLSHLSTLVFILFTRHNKLTFPHILLLNFALLFLLSSPVYPGPQNTTLFCRQILPLACLYFHATISIIMIIIIVVIIVVLVVVIIISRDCVRGWLWQPEPPDCNKLHPLNIHSPH